MPAPESLGLARPRSAEAVHTLKKIDKKPLAPTFSPVKWRPTQPQLLASQALPCHLAVHAETLWGDRLMLVGSSAQLGRWNPAESSVELTTDRKSYPVWRVSRELTLPPNGEALEYKVIIVRSRGGGALEPLFEWEPLPENRRIAPNESHKSKTAHVSIRWGEHPQSVQWRWEW